MKKEVQLKVLDAVVEAVENTKYSEYYLGIREFYLRKGYLSPKQIQSVRKVMLTIW